MKHLTAFGWYWLIWGFAGFLIPELYWLWRNASNTLSDEWWALEQMNFGHPFDFADWTLLHYILGLLLFFFVLWLFVHLTFGFLR